MQHWVLAATSVSYLLRVQRTRGEASDIPVADNDTGKANARCYNSYKDFVVVWRQQIGRLNLKMGVGFVNHCGCDGSGPLMRCCFIVLLRGFVLVKTDTPAGSFLR